MWRKLNKADELEFRRWARENWNVNQKISCMWHPITVSECYNMIAESLEDDDSEKLNEITDSFVRSLEGKKK